MKLNTLLILILGSLVWVGLPSCSSNPNAEYQASTQTQKEIKITGAATPYPAMKKLADAYKERGVQITFLPASQSPGGIAGVKDGLVEIGTVTRKIKPEEDNGQLEYRELAKDALVVATHKSVAGVSDLSTEQLKEIYSGTITNWRELGGPDATIVVLDRPEDESAKRLLRRHYLGAELKNSPQAVILRHESDLIATVENTPYSIGAFSLARAIANNLPVNRLSLNGIAPTPDNVQQGKYLMARNLGVVFQKNPSPTIQDFIDFIATPEAATVMRESGYVPSTQI